MPELEELSGNPLESAPSGFPTPIDPYDEEELVIEGSEGAPVDPPELAGKSREELAAQLRGFEEQLKAERERNDPVKALGASLQEVLSRSQNVQPIVQPQYVPPQEPRESAEQRKARLNNLWLEDPARATDEIKKEVQSEAIRPLVDLLIQQGVTMSKEMMLMNSDQKAVYDKYGEEVEREVQAMSPFEKAQNPRIYQTALERVRSRHTTDIIQEQVAAQVAATLKSMGIEPGVPPKAQPAVFSPAGQPRAAAPAAGGKRQVVVPKWVVDEADRQGLDPKFYYYHLKEKGRIK